MPSLRSHGCTCSASGKNCGRYGCSAGRLNATWRALGYVTSGYISEVETDKKKPSLELVLKVTASFQVTTDQLTRDDLELEVDTGSASSADDDL